MSGSSGSSSGRGEEEEEAEDVGGVGFDAEGAEASIDAAAGVGAADAAVGVEEVFAVVVGGLLEPGLEDREAVADPGEVVDRLVGADVVARCGAGERAGSLLGEPGRGGGGGAVGGALEGEQGEVFGEEGAIFAGDGAGDQVEAEAEEEERGAGGDGVGVEGGAAAGGIGEVGSIGGGEQGIEGALEDVGGEAFDEGVGAGEQAGAAGRGLEGDAEDGLLVGAHGVAEGAWGVVEEDGGGGGRGAGGLDLRAVGGEGLGDEGLDVAVIADREAGLGEHVGELFDLDEVLGEDGARLTLAVGGGVPRAIELATLGSGEFEGGLAVGGGVVAEEQALEDRLGDGVCVHRDRYGDAELVVDGAVLAEEDLEDDAVDGVVLAVEGDGADCGARLAVTIDAALALLVAGGVPGEVVVEDGVEGVLEVDALGEAVGADEDAAIGLGEASDAIFSLFRGGARR
jgi:hypothetical protein